MTSTYTPSKDEAWVLLSYIFNKVQDPENPNKSIWTVNYPPTQKPFTEKNAESLVTKLSAHILQDLKSMEDTEKATLEVKDMDKAQIPIYEAVIPEPSGDKETDEREYKKNQEELRLKFQNIVRRFLRSEKNPATQLAFLNKIQQQTKFHLFNPDGSRKAQRSKHGSSAYNSLKYGYADLLRFLCEPVKSGEVARLTRANPIGYRYVVDENGEYKRNYKGEYVKAELVTDGKTRYRKESTSNPFYNPIQYDVPDERGNELLERLYVGARQYYAKKVAELAYLKKELKTKPSKERRRSILENMLLIFRQIHDNRFDPIHLSKQIKGQQRPMETYRNEHFYELLEQMSTRKRLAPTSVRERPPRGNTGISITNPVLDHVEKKTVKHHKKRRHSKKHSKSHSSSSSEEEV